MDRRSRYTVSVIKDALLEIMSAKSFTAVTIADICRAAEIHRTTFYLHFERKEDVLDALLDDAFKQVESSIRHLNENSDNCKIPLCIFIRENKKYQPIFKDVSLENYVIGKLAICFKDDFVKQLCENSLYSKEEAETLFWFQIHGCYSLTVHNINLEGKEWKKKKNALDKFIHQASFGLTTNL